MTDLLIDADEVADRLGIGKSKAYKIIKILNNELEQRGYLTITGKASRKYFFEKFYGGGEVAN